MNEPLLRQIQEKILAAPQSFDMNQWITKTRCGTVCCIAGWTARMVDPWANEYNACSLAASALGLSESSANRLFLSGYWPTQYKSALSYSRDRREYAQIASARIDHFIATGGAE